MRYLLDTDVIVDHLKGKQKIDDSLIKKGCAISIITYAELLYGAYRSADEYKTLKVIFSFIENLGIKVLNLNEEIVKHFAKLKVQLETQGVRLDDFDLFIASTALLNNLTLATRNIKHFKRVEGLKIRFALKTSL